MHDRNEDALFMEPQQLRELMRRRAAVTVVDVRSPEEFAASHIDGAINIPADQLPTRVAELDSTQTIVTVCNHGGSRSRTAAERLRALGYDETLPLRGGTHGWLAEQTDLETKPE